MSNEHTRLVMDAIHSRNMQESKFKVQQLVSTRLYVLICYLSVTHELDRTVLIKKLTIAAGQENLCGFVGPDALLLYIIHSYLFIHYRFHAQSEDVPVTLVPYHQFQNAIQLIYSMNFNAYYKKGDAQMIKRLYHYLYNNQQMQEFKCIYIVH